MRAAPPAAIGWRALLATLALATCRLAFVPDPPPLIDSGWDKLNHAIAFSAMAFSAWQGFARAPRRHLVPLGLLVFGVFIELVQSQIPDRSAEVTDVLADAVGIAAGIVIASAWQRFAPGS